MKSEKEIITLQFGHLANFVGAHYWNIQDQLFNLYGEETEFDFNQIYRYGQTPNKLTTCTPRCMIFDAKGSLGSLKQDGILYSPSAKLTKEHVNDFWGGKVEFKENEPESKIDFIKELESGKVTKESRHNLTQSVRVWSDFLIPHLHPKTIQILKSHDVKDKFNVYTDGNILKDQSIYDSYMENLLFFIEECDTLQGFQVFTNNDDAWAKMAVDVIDLIHDEIGTKHSILTFGVDKKVFEQDNEEYPKDLGKKMANQSIAMVDLIQKSNLYVPLSSSLDSHKFQYMNLVQDSMYQVSAVLASAIDTATLCYRRKRNVFDMRSLSNGLNVMPSMRLSALSTCSPFAVTKKQTLFDVLSSSNPIHQFGGLVSLAPQINRSKEYNNPLAHSSSLRGVTWMPFLPEMQRFGEKKSDFESYAHCKNHFDVFEAYTDKTKSYSNDPHVYSQGSACPISYPDFFKENVLEDGTIGEKRQDFVLSYPHMTELETTKEILPWISTNLETMKKFNLKTRHEYNLHPDDVEEYREACYRIYDDYNVKK